MTISGTAHDPTARPRIAVLLTTYGDGSHGMAIVNKLLEGLDFGDRVDEPRCDVVAMHLMEIAGDAVIGGPDIGRAMAEKHGVPQFHSVAAALCRGGSELDVDGVVIIGEHGSWPEDEQGRLLYPRRELFDQVVGVFRQAGRTVPVFNDKELSWNWSWAKHMWAQVQELGIPFMAGSSLPLAQFEPQVPLPNGHAIDDVVVVGSDAPLGRYGSHMLELGQSVVERRSGGEVGVARVRCTIGIGGLERLALVSPDLIAAALAAGDLSSDLSAAWGPGCHVIEVEYRDSVRLTVMMLDPHDREQLAIAYRTRGSTDVISTGYDGDPPPRVRHFSSLVRAIEDLMLARKPPMAPERVVLTTGVLAYAFESAARGGAWTETPDLDIRYSPMPIPEAWHEVLR